MAGSDEKNWFAKILLQFPAVSSGIAVHVCFVIIKSISQKCRVHILIMMQILSNRFIGVQWKRMRISPHGPNW